ncbi:MAG: HEAT repeat domain-containing protein [Planctomycetaceae bacterium]|nr:HEAT repeat domain-containing protein [Planctomycetaceae bacterium]MBT6485700.1 HEAT repeat domain-containing protein [Planctomycetaceae bacterium]MBT6496527.1 HEAT repeat domain-containing protein [Planctomycetaceae bacterium]
MSRLVNRYASLAMIALMACSGCRLFDTDALPFGNSLSTEMLDAMRQQLDRDSWQPSPNSSLLEMEFADLKHYETNHARRWVFGNKILDNAISQLDTARTDRSPKADGSAEPSVIDPEESTHGESAVATSPDAQHWNGFWPLDVEDVLDSLDDDPSRMSKHTASSSLGKRYLKRLAGENTLSGWNAVILLAQRDPVAAREFLPVLERIVTSYKNVSQPEIVDGGTVAEAKADNEGAGSSNESIDALIKQIAQQMNAEWDLANETDGKTKTPAKPKPPSKQAKLLENVLERVNEASPLKKAAEEKTNLEKLSVSMRAAAAEAWCLALASSAADPYEQLIPAGRVLERPDLPNRVRGELCLSIANHVAPALIPRLLNALRVSDEGRRAPLQVRQAAVESCLIHALAQRSRGTSDLQYDGSLWPETIINCREDSDPTIRRTFGRWAAVVKYRRGVTDASSILETQLDDRHTQVRLDALESLGWLGTPSARKTLREQAQRPEATIRAAALGGLSRWGVEELAPFVADQSSPVRQVVAKKLAHYPSTRSYFVMQDLLRDEDLQVQAAAVTSLDNWRDDPALTLLLVALRDSSGPTRRLAFQQLRRRRPIDDAFSDFNSPRHEQRTRAVADLGSRLDVPLHFSDSVGVETFGSPHKPNALFVRDVESLLQVVTAADQFPGSPRHADAVSQLMKLQRDDLPIVEQFLLKQRAGDTGFVYRKLLPRLSSAHAALNEMEYPDLQRKRRGARQLREAASSESLSRLVVRRLLLQLDSRQDVLIWHDAMTAVMHDATDDHAQVALRALNDDRADVRFLGCEYILRHPRPQYANWLQQLQLFGDPDQRVRLVAVKAAGLCGNPNVLQERAGKRNSSDTEQNTAARNPGLRSLLTNQNADLRIAAVIAMARLGDRLGMQELSRLSLSTEPRIRIQAIQAMGETDSTWFIEPLIRRGWTERHIDVRRAILSSLDQLTLPGKRPANLVDENSYDAKIKKWHEWWGTGHRSRIARRIER